MTICIVPVKPLGSAKARLAPALSPGERRDLSLAMLADVLAAARALGVVWALVADEEAAEVARTAGAEPRPDPAPGAGLNASVDAAAAEAVAAGARGVLVLAADLPAATPDDVIAVAAGDGVSLVPSLDGRGTNALWRSPPLVIPAAFGPGSRRAHEGLARGAGVPFRAVDRPALALDIDTPADLDRLRAAAPGPHTRAWLDARDTRMTAARAGGYPQTGR